MLIGGYLLICIIACIFQPNSPTVEQLTSLNVKDGIETVEITGRRKFPIWKKLNIVWWFLNEAEPNAPDWYHPGQNTLVRHLSWYARNTFQNAGNYVFGVCDRNYTVSGPQPVMVVTYDDLVPPLTGRKWSVISIGWLRLPFISYVSSAYLIYAGWQPNGFFGFKFNWRNTPTQVV